MATADSLTADTQSELASYVAFATTMVIKQQEVADQYEAVALLLAGQGTVIAQAAAAGSASQWARTTVYVNFETGAQVLQAQPYWVALPAPSSGAGPETATSGDGTVYTASGSGWVDGSGAAGTPDESWTYGGASGSVAGGPRAAVDASGAVWVESGDGRWDNLSTGVSLPAALGGWAIVALPDGPCFVDPVGKAALVAVQTWVDRLTGQVSAGGPALAQNQFPNAPPSSTGVYPAGLSALIPTSQDYVQARLLQAAGAALPSAAAQALASYAADPASLTYAQVLLAGGLTSALLAEYQAVGAASSAAEAADLAAEYSLPPPDPSLGAAAARAYVQAAILRQGLLVIAGGLGQALSQQQAQISAARTAREVAYLLSAFGYADPFASALGLTAPMLAVYDALGSAASVAAVAALCSEYGYQPPSAVAAALAVGNPAQGLSIAVTAAQAQVLAQGLLQAVAIGTDAVTSAGLLAAGDLAQAIAAYQSTGSSPADQWEDVSQPLFLTNADGSAQLDSSGNPVPNPNRLTYVAFVGEKNDYYRRLVKYNGIDPLYSRTAAQFQVIQAGTGGGLTASQQSNFLATYAACTRVFLAAYYEPAYAQMPLYLQWCRMTICWMAIMRAMDGRLSGFGSVDDYGQWEATNQLYGYGLTGYDSMPLVYKQALLKVVETVLQDKGSFKSFFDIAGAFGLASQLTVYKYYLVKYFPSTTLTMAFPGSPGPGQGYAASVGPLYFQSEVVASDPGIHQSTTAAGALADLAAQIALDPGVASAAVTAPGMVSVSLAQGSPLTQGSFTGGAYDFGLRRYMAPAALAEGPPDYASPQVGFLQAPSTATLAEASTQQLDPSFLIDFNAVTQADPTWETTASQAAAVDFSAVQTKYVSLQFALDAAANGFLLSMLWTTLQQAEVEGRTAGLGIPGASGLPGVQAAGLFDSLVALLVLLLSQFGVDDAVPSTQEAAQAIIAARTDGRPFPNEGTLLPYSTVLARIEDYPGTLTPGNVGAIAQANLATAEAIEASSAPSQRAGGGATGAFDGTSSEWRTTLGELSGLQAMYDFKFLGQLQNSIWGGAATYTEWLAGANPGLLSWVQAQQAAGPAAVDEGLLELSSLLQAALPGFNFALAFGVDDVILAYVESLINYFISYTSQILPLTTTLVFDQPGYNALQLVNYVDQISVQLNPGGDGNGAGGGTPVWTPTGGAGGPGGAGGSGATGSTGATGATGATGGTGGAGGAGGGLLSGPFGGEGGGPGWGAGSTGWDPCCGYPFGITGGGGVCSVCAGPSGGTGATGCTCAGVTGGTASYGRAGAGGTLFAADCCGPTTARPYLFASDFFDAVGGWTGALAAGDRMGNRDRFLIQELSFNSPRVVQSAAVGTQQPYDQLLAFDSPPARGNLIVLVTSSGTAFGFPIKDGTAPPGYEILGGGDYASGGTFFAAGYYDGSMEVSFTVPGGGLYTMGMVEVSGVASIVGNYEPGAAVDQGEPAATGATGTTYLAPSYAPTGQNAILLTAFNDQDESIRSGHYNFLNPEYWDQDAFAAGAGPGETYLGGFVTNTWESPVMITGLFASSLVVAAGNTGPTGSTGPYQPQASHTGPAGADGARFNQIVLMGGLTPDGTSSTGAYAPSYAGPTGPGARLRLPDSGRDGGGPAPAPTGATGA